MARLLKIDITKLGAKEYYDVLTIYSGVLVRKVVTHSPQPAIVASLMVNHAKYAKNENLAKKSTATAIDDLDADFYGDESYNEDEFDLEGFDDMSFKE